MATWEMQLLSRVIRSGDLNSVTGWGIGIDDFLTGEGHGMFNLLTGYSAQPGTAGSVIGINAMGNYFPNFMLCDDTSMTTEALCRQVRRDRLNVQLKHQTSRAMELIDHDPVQAAQLINSASRDVMNLGYGQTTDVRAAVGASKISTSYSLRKLGVDMSVGKWPWQVLNDELGGISNDEYVVFYGRPKSFKSWILVCVVSAMLLQGKRVLLYTKEMPWEQIMERVYACIAQVRYWNLRKGLLNSVEETEFNGVCNMFMLPEFSEQLVCLSGMDAAGHDTIPWLRSKIESYKPDLVAIDGLHLMADARGAKKREERITNISRDTRTMVIDLLVPCVATVQANRGAAKHQEANLDEIAYSDAIGQDATAIFRTIKDKRTEEDQEQTVSIVTGAMRNGDLDGFKIHAEPARNFNFHSVLSAIDALKLKDQDDKAVAETKKKNGKSKMTEAKAAELGIRATAHALGRHAQATS